MSNALTMFDSPQANVPAHIASFFETDSNIAEKSTVPSLLIEGKVWTRSVDGEKVKLTKRNEDGEVETIQTLKVIILDYSKKRGRTYYEGAYDPAKPGTPVCWSNDGDKPDSHVPKPVNADCKSCPMSVKGSRISDQGKPVTACSSQRMLAVVPAAQPTSTPLRLKLSITSLYDKQSPDLEASGWFAFEQYVDMLRSRGVHHTAAVVTKMKFDSDAAFPKVIFSPDRWLENSELAVVAPITKEASVKALIDGTFTPNGDAGVKADEFEQGDQVPAPAPKAAPAPAPKAAPAPAPKPAPEKPVKAKPSITPAAAPAPAPKQEPVVETVAEQAAAASTDIPQDVQDLLADWG